MKKVRFRQDIGFPLINITLLTKLNLKKTKKLLIRWCILRFVSRTNGELLTVTAIFLCKLLIVNVCPLHKHDGGLHYSSVLEPFEILFPMDGICFAFSRIPPNPSVLL